MQPDARQLATELNQLAGDNYIGRALGVDPSTVFGWRHGVTPQPYAAAKLRRLHADVFGYRTDLAGEDRYGEAAPSPAGLQASA